IGWVDKGYGSALFHLLPFIERDSEYNASNIGGFYCPLNNKVYSKPIPEFVCPSDPTAGGGVVLGYDGKQGGAGSSAANAQVFCRVDGTGALLNPEGKLKLSQVKDGTQNTILFAERFALCSNSNYEHGGTYWAYEQTGALAKPLYPAFAISW